MKLTETDKQAACEYIMDQSCRIYYGDDYKEKDIHFSFDRVPVTVRQIVDLFIEWLKKKIQDDKTNQIAATKIENSQKT